MALEVKLKKLTPLDPNLKIKKQINVHYFKSKIKSFHILIKDLGIHAYHRKNNNSKNNSPNFDDSLLLM